MTQTIPDAVLTLARISLDFGTVDRVTFHPDGKTLESDTDHTVMLGLIACAFAAEHPEMHLDIGLVARYALVHDLPEVYAGDTPTTRALTPEARAEKARREARALGWLADETKALPWVATSISSYELLDTPEARYVKAMDKVLPKLCHILNDGQTLLDLGMSSTEVAARYVEQDEEMRGYAADFPQIFELRSVLIEKLLAKVRWRERCVVAYAAMENAPLTAEEVGSYANMQDDVPLITLGEDTELELTMGHAIPAEKFVAALDAMYGNDFDAEDVDRVWMLATPHQQDCLDTTDPEDFGEDEKIICPCVSNDDAAWWVRFVEPDVAGAIAVTRWQA